MATIRLATRLMLSASATDEPPYFCTIRPEEALGVTRAEEALGITRPGDAFGNPRPEDAFGVARPTPPPSLQLGQL